jgi:hypothetical protein
MLTTLFIVLAFGALTLALAMLFLSLRGVLGTETDARAKGPDATRRALLEEKHSVLRALKDLEFERSLGKISEDDHASLEAKYRTRAKEILLSLDENLGPWRKKAEALVAAETTPEEPS